MHAWAVVESGAPLQRIELPTPEPRGTEDGQVTGRRIILTPEAA